MSKRSRSVFLGASLLAAIAGCSSGPSAICVAPTRCDEYFNYSSTELSNASSQCDANQGTWSTSDTCATASTNGSCRVPYNGDANAYSIVRIYNATGEQEMADCAAINGSYASN